MPGLARQHKGGGKMPESPKLRVKNPAMGIVGDIYELEQARSLFSSGDMALITVEDRVIRSYDELVELTRKEPYKDKEFLEVRVELMVGGG